ncbi:hypothetical protein BCT04_12525 [Vibrio breoganii]|nr:hypothetical protein BCT61_15900 [Vibrio breoganii]PMM46213.1 hypothetical protein BCT52_07335 [Vibrio breoganii]PMO65803.1 hypothetical protein BCT04_12525 [Vibrio breoganii]
MSAVKKMIRVATSAPLTSRSVVCCYYVYFFYNNVGDVEQDALSPYEDGHLEIEGILNLFYTIKKKVKLV